MIIKQQSISGEAQRSHADLCLYIGRWLQVTFQEGHRMVDPENTVITQNTIVPQIRDAHLSLCYDLRHHSWFKQTPLCSTQLVSSNRADNSGNQSVKKSLWLNYVIYCWFNILGYAVRLIYWFSHCCVWKCILRCMAESLRNVSLNLR